MKTPINTMMNHKTKTESQNQETPHNFKVEHSWKLILIQPWNITKLKQKEKEYNHDQKIKTGILH